VSALGKDCFQKKLLCRVPVRAALGKYYFFKKNKKLLAECLPRQHSAKKPTDDGGR